MSAKLKIKKTEIAMLIRKQFSIRNPNHDATMFSLEELHAILQQVSEELAIALVGLYPVSHEKLSVKNEYKN